MGIINTRGDNMIEIRIKKNYSKPLILCNLLHAGFKFFEDTLKTEKFSKEDNKELNKLLLKLGLLVYNICDTVEKYDK